MHNLRITIPNKLYYDAQKLVDQGMFTSLNEAIQTALSRYVRARMYERMVEEAKSDLLHGRGVVLHNKKEIEAYFSKL